MTKQFISSQTLWRLAQPAPWKEGSQHRSGAGRELCGFSTKAQQHGMSCCTLSPGSLSKGCHRSLSHGESSKLLHFCPLVSACIKFFAVLKENEILHHILQMCLSSLPMFALFPFYPKLIAVFPIFCTFISLLLLLTVSCLAHLPGSPTILSYHNNWAEMFHSYWLSPTLKSHFNSSSF